MDSRYLIQPPCGVAAVVIAFLTTGAFQITVSHVCPRRPPCRKLFFAVLALGDGILSAVTGAFRMLVSLNKPLRLGSRRRHIHFLFADLVGILLLELHPKSWTRKSTKGMQKSMGKELFSEELKLAVVQYVLEEHTRKEASEKFCVSCTPIEKWVNLYKLHGTKGLLSRNLVGRQKGFDGEFRLKVLQYKQEQSELQQENKRLSEENYRLRMENDYLKKLNALIQKWEKPE